MLQHWCAHLCGRSWRRDTASTTACPELRGATHGKCRQGQSTSCASTSAATDTIRCCRRRRSKSPDAASGECTANTTHTSNTLCDKYWAQLIHSAVDTADISTGAAINCEFVVSELYATFTFERKPNIVFDRVTSRSSL